MLSRGSITLDNNSIIVPAEIDPMTPVSSDLNKYPMSIPRNMKKVEHNIITKTNNPKLLIEISRYFKDTNITTTIWNITIRSTVK